MKTQYRKNTKTDYNHKTFKEWWDFSWTGTILSPILMIYIVPILVLALLLGISNHPEYLVFAIIGGFIVFGMVVIISTWRKQGTAKALSIAVALILIANLAVENFRYRIYVNKIPEPARSEMTIVQKLSGFYNTNSMYIRHKAKKLESKDFRESIKGLDRAQRVEKSIIHSIDRVLFPPSKEYIEKAAARRSSRKAGNIFKKTKEDNTDSQ